MSDPQTTTITVVHASHIPGNGDITVFSGQDIEYRFEDGALRIIGWETSSQSGHALFAPGQWTYVCLSKETNDAKS